VWAQVQPARHNEMQRSWGVKMRYTKVRKSVRTNSQQCLIREPMAERKGERRLSNELKRHAALPRVAGPGRAVRVQAARTTLRAVHQSDTSENKRIVEYHRRLFNVHLPSGRRYRCSNTIRTRRNEWAAGQQKSSPSRNSIARHGRRSVRFKNPPAPAMGSRARQR